MYLQSLAESKSGEPARVEQLSEINLL